ncbi:hypothetical protein IG631_12067 [Alternaria alternata]|nr:hypothetical protein IG631_12067 [Alternaria alternata]
MTARRGRTEPVTEYEHSCPFLTLPNLTKLWWCQATRQIASERAVSLHLALSSWSPDPASSVLYINFMTTTADLREGERTMSLHCLLSYDVMSSTLVYFSGLQDIQKILGRCGPFWGLATPS